jgi:hypothetical protein
MFSNCSVGWQDKFEDAKLHFEERQSSKKYIKITHFILGNRWNLSVTHYWRQILFMIVCPNFNFNLTWRILNLLLLPNLNNRNVIRVSRCIKDKFHAIVSLLILGEWLPENNWICEKETNVSPILHTWFRDSCFTCDSSSTVQVFHHSSVLFQMDECCHIKWVIAAFTVVGGGEQLDDL